VVYRWFPSILQVLTIIRPETLIRWHRSGFRCYWRWNSRSLEGRPQIEAELRTLIRRMSMDTPLWGAPRIHGELLKLGFEVAQSSAAKYMVKRRGPPDQGWRRVAPVGIEVRRASYARYYNDIRTHRSLDKDAPVSRPVQRTGSIKSFQILGVLHHHYVRV
jgi:hypothetical protein